MFELFFNSIIEIAKTEETKDIKCPKCNYKFVKLTEEGKYFCQWCMEVF